MRVMVQSVLPNCVEAIWNEVQTSRLLVEVASPLVAIRPVKHESLPARWIAGTTVRIRSYLFGIIPLGTRALHFESVDDTTHEIQTRESDPLIRRWDHLISVQPAADGRCRYRDQIEIEAGLFTPIVWLFAIWFYRHRQRRWQAVAERLAHVCKQ